MSRIKFNDFEKNYGLKLLPVSMETYKVGHKVEWDNLFHTRFEIEQAFFTDFMKLAENLEKEFEEKLNSLNKLAPSNGSFVALDIDKSNSIKSALNIPQLGVDLTGSVDATKVKNFSYENITVKALKDEVRSDLIDRIQEIREANKQLYNDIRHIMFLEELFYASKVEMVIEKGYETDVKLAMEKFKLDFDVAAEGTNHTRITFGNPSQCPFAVKFETVEDIAD